MKPTCTRWLFLFLLFALPADPALAQTTTASITGRVVDEAGAPLPGANVLAVHQPTGTRYGTATDADGRYNLLGMRVGGPYSIRASFVGFRPAEETGFQLTLGQKRTIVLELSEAAAELQGIEVVGTQSTVVNSNRTGAATNVSQEQIDRLPTISRSLSDFSRLTPQAAGGGSISIAGRNNRYNNIQVDGATLNDVFGLSGSGTPGGQAGAEPISLDAVKEFNVEIAPYDVRQSGFTGGLLNAVTKSGSNAFEGSLRYRLGNEAFVGDFGDEAFGDFTENLYVGTLGGPIIEDELFFFVNAEVKREGFPENAAVGNPDAATNFDLTGAELDALGFASEQEVFEAVQQIAQEQYGYNPGGFSPLTERQDNFKILAKLDWNINDAHRLTVRNNYVNAQEDDGLGRGDDSFGFSNQIYVFDSVTNSLTAQLNTTLADDMYNEARVVWTRIRDSRTPRSPFPEVTINLDESGDKSINLGVDRFSQANALDQDLFEITNDFSYIVGDHTLTVGTNNQAFRFSNLFIQDFYGSYTFEPFEEDGEAVTALGAFRRGRPVEYNFSYSLVEGEAQPRAEFTGYQFGLYVQDEWQAMENLRLTGGLRVDVPFLPEEPRRNAQAEDAFPGFSTTTRASGLDVALFSPRLGFNYSRERGAFTTQVRGGTGLFSGRPPFVWISNQYSNTGVDFARLDVNLDPAEIGDNDCFGGSSDPAAQPRPGGACAGLSPVQTTEINLISEDFRYPRTWRSNLAVDQELPGGVTATLEAIYSNTFNDVVYENLNIARAEGGLTESKYGRPLYGAATGFRGSVNRVDPAFTNALLLKNTDEGYEYSLTAQLQRQVIQGFSGSVSYTYNRAENVNNATSSRAISNWQFNENLDVNNPRLGTADFEVRHRVLVYGDYRFLYGENNRFGTTIGFVYDGQAGEPFSWIYAGDANADGQSFNDLVFVPATERDVFLDASGAEAAGWDLLDAFIENFPSLDEARGTVVSRNTARVPWNNILDLRLSQSFETFQGQRVEIEANLENLFAFADQRLGLENSLGDIQFTRFNNITLFDFDGYVGEEAVGACYSSATGEFFGPEGGECAGAGLRIVTQDDVGKPIITFDEETVRESLNGDLYGTADFSSRWRLRLGVRYTF